MMMFHPTSEWLEPDRDDGLTLYEIHRPPLLVGSGAASIPGTTTSRVRRSLQDVNSEFKCGICLQYIANARIVRNCLHRFCYDCAETALRKRYKHCPICRAPMGSRRCLAPDPAFDRLVKTIVGDPASDPIQALDRDDEGHSHNAERLQVAIQQKRQWLRQQQQQQPQQHHPSLSAPGPPVAPSHSLGATADDALLLRHEDWIRVELRRHVQETDLDDLRLPYLRLQKHMPLLVLQTFLLHKLDLFRKQKNWEDVPSETPPAEEAHGTLASDDERTEAPQKVDGTGEETVPVAPMSLQLFVQTPDYTVHPLLYYSHDNRREIVAPATTDHSDVVPPPSSSSSSSSSSSRLPVLLGAVHRQYHQHGRLRLFYRRTPPSLAPTPALDSSAPTPRHGSPVQLQGSPAQGGGEEEEAGGSPAGADGRIHGPEESTPLNPYRN